jgi:NAD(P)-dependent dehydrogenase (short-subunit alcohol dehydrogenase family)
MEVGDEAAVQRTVATVVEWFGQLDVLVNNAGGSVLEMTLADWNAVITSHLTGTLLCSKHAARAMVNQQEGGKIVDGGYAVADRLLPE